MRRIRAGSFLLATLLAVGPSTVLGASAKGLEAAGNGGGGALGDLGDSGVSWGSKRNVGSNYTWSIGAHLARTSSATKSYLHEVATTDRVNGTWADNNGPYVGVNYVRGNATGSSWGTPFRVNPKSQHGDGGTIAASGKYVYVAWFRFTKFFNYDPEAARTLYFRRNTSHGASDSWKARVTLTSTTGRVGYPTIAAAGTYVYVAYTDSDAGSVQLAISPDRGVTWSTTTVGTTTEEIANGFEAEPSVAAAGSNVIVSWVGDSSFSVHARTSTNNGTDWDDEMLLSDSASGTNVAAARDTRMGVAWTDDNGARFRLWHEGGAWDDATTAGPPEDAGRTYGRHRAPAIAFGDAGQVGVAWTACWQSCDEFLGTTREDLVWAESNNGGAAWFNAQTVQTAGSTYRINDAASVLWPTAGQRVVAWNGWHVTDGFYRMFLKVGSATG
jgi:hypothetical protein